MSIRRIEDIVCEYSGRYQTWSLLQETPIRCEASHLDEQNPRCLEDWENLDFQDLVVDGERFQVAVDCYGGGGEGVLSFGCSSLEDVRLTKSGYLTLIFAVFLLKFGEFVLDELVMDNVGSQTAKRWVDRLPPRTVDSWDLLKKAFIQRYCPPSKTANQLEEIRNFKQEGDETLYQAWEWYNDLLYKCPTHDINNHQKILTFALFKGIRLNLLCVIFYMYTITRTTPVQALTAIQTMADHSQKWHDGSSNKNIKSSSNSEGISAIVNKLENLGRDMNKLKENVHAIQVGCQTCEGAHLDKDCPLNEEVNGMEEPSSGEKRPNLTEIINKYMEEASKKQAEQDEWLKKFYQSTEGSLETHDKIIQGLEAKEQETDDSRMTEAVAALEATLKKKREEPKKVKQNEVCISSDYAVIMRHEDRTYTSQAWNVLFRIQELVIREYVLEFLSSFKFRDHVTELDIVDTMGAKKKSMIVGAHLIGRIARYNGLGLGELFDDMLDKSKDEVAVAEARRAHDEADGVRRHPNMSFTNRLRAMDDRLGDIDPNIYKLSDKVENLTAVVSEMSKQYDQFYGEFDAIRFKSLASAGLSTSHNFWNDMDEE
ncbi:hypothetical protein Tco_0044997 [Tanacetum coccineum]